MKTTNYDIVRDSATNFSDAGDELVCPIDGKQPTIRFTLDDGSTLDVENVGDHIVVRSRGVRSRDARVVVTAEVSNVVNLRTEPTR